jgi:hypothetical protein
LALSFKKTDKLGTLLQMFQSKINGDYNVGIFIFVYNHK